VTRAGDVATYQVLAGPLAFLTPGFPYPWRHRVVHVVTLRGEVAGTSVPLGSRRAVHDEHVWGADMLARLTPRAAGSRTARANARGQRSPSSRIRVRAPGPGSLARLLLLGFAMRARRHVRLLLVIAMVVGVRAGWLTPAAAVASMRAYAHCIAHGHGDAVPDRCCHVRRDAADPAAKPAVTALPPAVTDAVWAPFVRVVAFRRGSAVDVAAAGPLRFLLLQTLRC
jgi:hypothetical protein